MGTSINGCEAKAESENPRQAFFSPLSRGASQDWGIIMLDYSPDDPFRWA